MYSDGYHGPRVEVTILKNGVKHKISQAYLMRVIDVSDKVKKDVTNVYKTFSKTAPKSYVRLFNEPIVCCYK